MGEAAGTEKMQQRRDLSAVDNATEIPVRQMKLSLGRSAASERPGQFFVDFDDPSTLDPANYFLLADDRFPD